MVTLRLSAVCLSAGCLLASLVLARPLPAIDRHGLWSSSDHEATCGHGCVIDLFGIDAVNAVTGTLPEDVLAYEPLQANYEALSPGDGPIRITASTANDLLGNTLDNLSTPARWAKWRYAPVQLTVSMPATERPAAIRFWHNGKAAHPELIQPQSDWILVQDGGRAVFERSFMWSSPPLGQSNLQVEINVGDRWSQLSRTLHLEMVPAQAPVIVAVGTESTQLHPWSEKLGVIACDKSLIIQLANLSGEATVLADVHGYGTLMGVANSSDRVEFDLSRLITSGRYRITLRYAASDQAVSMSSDRSAVLWIDFHNPDQQISIDNTYAKIHHQALNAWILSTSSDSVANALSEQATEFGQAMTTIIANGLGEQAIPARASVQIPRNERGADNVSANGNDENRLLLTALQEDVAPAVVPPQPLTLDTLANREAQMFRAIERMNNWKATRQHVKQAIASSDYVSEVSFDTAATFPRRTYGPGAQEYATSGLMILEGMQFRVAADGQYCLEFNYVPPQVPCTLHLQLQVQTEENGPWYALSLAPMALKSVRELDKPTNEVMHQVGGSSSVLARSAGDVIAIRRRGSAAMGFGHKILQSGQHY